MFVLNAGFFIGVTGGTGNMWVSQKNHWTLAMNAQPASENKNDQEWIHRSPFKPILDFFIGGEAKLGQNHLWSNSIGIGYMPFELMVEDYRYFVCKDNNSNIQNWVDQYHTRINNNVVLQGRSMIGFMSKCRYFLFGLSGIIFKMSQSYKADGLQPNEFSKWHGALGPCMSVKVNLAPHFRFVCYGEVLFSPTFIERPDVDKFDAGDKQYTAQFSFKPSFWKVTAGFEVHFTKMKDCSIDSVKKVFEVKTDKQTRIEQLRKKVLGKHHSYHYYSCPKQKRRCR